ncbi:UTRA domain-containing protein [Streptomyces sp. CB01201]|uniref:UTRA domain-containing protein n=1 Tax=Streptomyces sp. CB01201 TaxID=2020324 RepID=UPI000C277194|nr:UTRA domain-containing protein [Streptomyces sp. CB01201]PJN00819.1 UTRA domain-containing protein [Streptomyces sp. CB01201]
MAEKQRRNDSIAYATARDPGQPDAWTAESQGRGSQRLTEVSEVAPPQEVATALAMTPDEKAVVRRRAVLLNDDVIELADSYYPLSVARGTALAEKRKIKGGAPTLLASLGYRATRLVEDVELREAHEAECAALALPAGSNVLTLLRATAGEDGTPYEVQFMVMKAPRRLHYEIEVD